MNKDRRKQIIGIVALVLIVLAGCDQSPYMHGTVLEVNDTGVRVEWTDGTVGSYRTSDAAFIGDTACAYAGSGYVSVGCGDYR